MQDFSQPAHRPSRRRAALLLAGVALLALVASLLWPREPRLLDRARQGAVVTDWEIDRGPDTCMPFWWVSDHEVVHMKDGPQPYGVYRLDTRTGVDTPLVALTNVIRMRPGDPAELYVSPNGRKVLWSAFGRPYSCTTDGSGLAQEEGLHYLSEPVVWLDGGGSFATLEFGGTATSLGDVHVYRLGTRKAGTRYSVGSHPQRDYCAAWTVRKTLPPRLAVVLASKDWSGTPYDKVDIAQCPLTAKPADTVFNTVRLPVAANLQNAVFSPQGDRVAWQLGITSKPVYPAWVCRLLPFLKGTHSRRFTLWVSRIDGSDMHEIGTLPDDPTVNGPPLLDDLQWLPDGKTLSFVVRKPEAGKWIYRLYTVPAD